MRLTTHNARSGKSGPFLAKHNDRDFDTQYSNHIDPEKSRDNIYWHLYIDEYPDITFEEAEQKFYQIHFSNALNSQNKRYLMQRHKDKCRTIEEVYKSPLSCPEESIFQIGSIADGSVDPETLLNIYKKYSNRRKRDFPQITVLDYALHADEQGAPHIHERIVWIGHKDREEIPSQAKALKEMGVGRPHPDKPQGRYNNPKQLYSEICRQTAMQICKEYGLDIEQTPKESSEWGLSLTEYKRRQEELQIHSIQCKSNNLMQTASNTEIRLQAAEKQLHEVKESIEQAGVFLHLAEIRKAFYILNRERERTR